MAYVEIQKNQFERIFENVYRWQKKLFRPIIKDFIDDFILDKNHLLPQRIYSNHFINHPVYLCLDCDYVELYQLPQKIDLNCMHNQHLTAS